MVNSHPTLMLFSHTLSNDLDAIYMLIISQSQRRVCSFSHGDDVTLMSR